MIKETLVVVGVVFNVVVWAAVGHSAALNQSATPSALEATLAVPSEVAESSAATMRFLIAAGDRAARAGDPNGARQAYEEAYAIALVDLPEAEAHLASAYIVSKIGPLLKDGLLPQSDFPTPFGAQAS